MAEKPDKKTPRDLLRVIFRRRLMFLVSAAVFAFAALVGACWWPLKYTGEAKFERRSDPASENLTTGKSESFDTIKLTLAHELGGQNAVEAAVDDIQKAGLYKEMGLDAPLPVGSDGKLTPEGKRIKQALVNSLMTSLKVNFDVRSDQVDLVSVNFTHPNPRLAQEMPNTLVTNYMNLITEQIIKNLTASRDFLQGKVKDASTRLSELTAKQTKFEATHAGMLPDNPGALYEQVSRLNSDIDTVRRQQSIAKQKLERLKALGAAQQGLNDSASTKPKAGPAAEIGNAPDAGTGAASGEEEEPAPDQIIKVPNPELARLEDDLRQTKRLLSDAQVLSHMTDKHPTVISLRNKIAELEKRIKETPKKIDEEVYLTRAPATPTTTDPDRLRQLQLLEEQRQRQGELRDTFINMDMAAAQSEIDGTTSDLERLQNRLAKLQELLSNLGPIRQEYLDIRKEVTDQQAEVARWQTRLTEVQMTLAAEAAKRRTHLQQVELAQEQFVPSTPKMTYVLALAILGGLAFGGGLVFLANTMDRSVATSEEAAEHFGLPVFGIVGEIVTPSQRRRKQLVRWIAGPLVSLVVVAALALATLNIVLWLQSREQYDQWKAAPVSFVCDQAAGMVQGLTDKLRG
jgi:uncharacterized protein involved in exopolysaccharide biosynthesis